MQLGLDGRALDLLLPMHLWIDPDGTILGAGPTMRKLLPAGASRISGAMTLLRQGVSHADPAAICRACREDERLFLRIAGRPRLTLRGHAVPAGGGFLLNLGFGIGLVDAVGELDLNDGDFAPPELAMELLFLHEANRAVMSELSRFNRHLDAAREAAERQAFTDPLTGLRNRRGLELAIAALLRSADPRDSRRARKGFAVAHLDLDHFKPVNDRHGHAAGDAVLRHVAQVLREAIRSHDTAARVGGDEFVLLLDNVDSPEALAPMARRIIRRIERPIDLGAAICRVSASIGIVWSPLDRSVPVDFMLADADAALYRSKHAGRGRVTVVNGAAAPGPG
ncbi:GGDEF domain-containing protein [Paracoccus siganidrum]|nr:GGDEF domain-containing protein [Paracoccus siganidrum]